MPLGDGHRSSVPYAIYQKRSIVQMIIDEIMQLQRLRPHAHNWHRVRAHHQFSRQHNAARTPTPSLLSVLWRERARAQTRA